MAGLADRIRRVIRVGHTGRQQEREGRMRGLPA